MKDTARIMLMATLMLLCTGRLRAEDILSFIDIRAYSMGRATAAISTVANPAGFAFERQRAASIGYVNRFALKELSSYSGCITLPAKAMDFTLYAARFGMDAYNENKISLSVTRRLTRWLALGLRINYYLRQLADHDKNVHALTADLGLLIKPTDILTIGVVINNPVRKGIVKGKTDEKLTASFAVGISYQPISTLLLTTEVEKTTQGKPWFKCGAEYTPVKVLDLRLGFLGTPFTPTFGIGLNLKKLTIDAGAKWHTRLGPELMCGLGYSF